MAGSDAESRQEVRAALLAKIEAAWPRYNQNAELARLIELASNDELRKHLAWAETIAEGALELPELDDDKALSPRYSEDDRKLFRRILSTKWNPSGGYTLAKDECGDWYAGRAWVPFNLFSHAEYCGYGSVQECAKTLIEAPGAEKLWRDILLRYGRDHCSGTGLDARRNNHADSIAERLPTVCADAKAGWTAIPRLTPSEFKKQRDELARRAEHIATELERFYLPRDPDVCDFPGMLDFMELMTPEKRDKLDQAIRITTHGIVNRARKEAGVVGMDWDEYNDIGKKARGLGYQSGDLHPPAREDAVAVYQLILRDHSNPTSDWGYGGVPTLPDMMRRIAGKFEADGNWPPIKSPNLGTAERSFFARALCIYFWKSYGDVSPAIVRDIVSMFYAESITEGNVSQMLAKIKAAHPLPNP